VTREPSLDPSVAPAEVPPTEWWLERDAHGVTARDQHRAVARVDVQERDADVRLAFWVDERLPRELRTRLTRTVFELPALRSRRSVSVALPLRESDVLQEVREHVADDSTHVAGATCLLEGRVR
jgi:hypothetical protein